ncbi:MAG TPA: hypothetical protein DEG17_01095, partial [Cyanobacteria bacterium UBA11149]|nr:hypothetical protein [Cyanobacteria bacterium UBA11149]
MLLFSPVVWTGWVRSQQELLRMQVRSRVAQIAEASEIPNWESLKASQQQLREAIASLETIPNTFASAYPQAQADITFVKSRLDNIEQRIKTEEEALGNLETTKKLAIEAAIIVQNPPHPVEVWQEAKVKWQTTIRLLEAIPEGSFFAVQAQEKLLAYRNNYEAIAKRLSTEEKAASSLSDATNLVWEAGKVLEKPLHPLAVWQQTEAKLQKAIQLLEAIPKNSPAF